MRVRLSGIAMRGNQSKRLHWDGALQSVACQHAWLIGSSIDTQHWRPCDRSFSARSSSFYSFEEMERSAHILRCYSNQCTPSFPTASRIFERVIGLLSLTDMYSSGRNLIGAREPRDEYYSCSIRKGGNSSSPMPVRLPAHSSFFFLSCAGCAVRASFIIGLGLWAYSTTLLYTVRS